MTTTKITKAQALTLAPDLVPEFGSHLGPFGVKVFGRKRGCVWTFYVSGYSPDGSDVRQALASIGVKK